MSNKMKKYFFISFFLVIFLTLGAFDPTPEQFETDYQYSLYTSWLTFNDFKPDTPAAFTSNTIKRIFQDDSYKVPVYYDWNDHRIFNQREDLSVWEYSHPADILKLLESIIYRLNCSDSIFIIDYLTSAQCEVKIGNFKGFEAIKYYFDDDQRGRFYPDQIEFVTSDDENFNIYKLYNDRVEISVFLPGTWTFQDEFSSYDAGRKIKISQSSKKEIIKSHPKIKKEEKQFDNLAEFVRYNANQRFYREVLNNKISDFRIFLNQEFPHHNIEKNGDNFIIQKTNGSNDIGGDIAIEMIRLEDGIRVEPRIDYSFDGEILQLFNDESYDLSSLEQQQKQMIAPYIPHLLYENRAVGTKLINLLFYHDDVPTTLIVYEKERKKYEFASYAELLLMLGDYWDHWNVDFELREFKNVNGFIEFKGLLIANDPQSKKEDLAEIWYHLDYNFRLDLIMMILHPDMKN